MPQLQKHAEESSSCGEEPSTLPTKRRSRKSPHADSVVLSSKYVVERIRERLESPDPDKFWGEYPKSNAEALEKRGIEIDVNPEKRFSRKRIRLAEPWPFSTSSKAPRREVKGRASGFPSPRSDSRQRYFLDQKDVNWLMNYNIFVTEKKLAQVTAESLERMIEMLEVKKNSYILGSMRSVISALSSAGEGTPRLHAMEYDALQRFVEMTPETFSKVAYKEIGQVCGLSPESSFDVWEYWKCRLQDGFYQPLLPPNAAEFDYRRLSLLVAWNMTNVSYAQRIRHDAERVRLMYDILQKRNWAGAKISSKEEEITSVLAELSLCPEMKHIPSQKVSTLMHFVDEFSAFNREALTDLYKGLDEYIVYSLHEDNLGRILPAPIPLIASNHLKRNLGLESPPLAICAPRFSLPIVNPEEESVSAVEKRMLDGVLSKNYRPPISSRSSLNLRKTRARVEIPKMVKFEHHSDNSCCENGPIDEEELIRERKGSIRLSSRPFLTGLRGGSYEEPLYLLNDISQKLNLPSRSPDLRSRLRTRRHV